MEVRRQCSIRPSVRIGAIETEGIGILSINVHRSITSPWCLVSLGPCIVADEGNNDTRISILVFYCLKVVTVGKLYVRSGLRILIFRLKKDDWASFGDLYFSNDLSDVFQVISGIIDVVRRPQYCFPPL